MEDNPDPPPTGVRTKRRQKNKETSEYVIKSSFVNSLKNKDKIHVQVLKDNINKRVVETSKGILRLSLSLNLMLRDIMSEKRNPLEIGLPQFLSGNDITFANHLMLGLNKARGDPDPCIIKFLEQRNNLLPNVPTRFIGDTNVLTRAAEQYLVNYRTYLTTNFERKQKIFLNTWCYNHGMEEDINTIRYLINGWTTRKAYVPNYKVFKLIEFQRKLLKLDDKINISTFWIKTNYETVIIYFKVISDYLIKNKNPGILVAPVSHIKMNFIQIDNRVFNAVLNEVSDTKISMKEFEANRDTHWNSIFDTQKYLTSKQKQDCNFTHCVQTDGVSICIHYRRPKIKSNEKDEYSPFNKHQSDRVIGQDPGRTTLFSGAEQLPDGNWKKHVLSKSRFYQESGINDVNRDSKRWNLSLKNILEQLSKTSMRTTISDCLGYIKIIKDNCVSLWTEYSKKKWARNRLKTGKKRVYDTFFNSIKDKSGRRVVIAYGDAGFKSSSKYELAAPTTRLKGETRKHFDVVLVDEFRTTQIEYRTGIRLSNVIKVFDDVKRKVRGLLWCNSTIGSKFIDRDFNASKNMVDCYSKYPNRPVGMNRIDDKQPESNKYIIIKESIGKTILSTSLYCGNILPFSQLKVFQNILG